MPTIVANLESNAPIPTWFGVGGRADLLARPGDERALSDLLIAFAHEPIRVLGDGANLLVHDEGVDGLTISLGAMNQVQMLEEDRSTAMDAGSMDLPRTRDRSVLVRAQAGANLPKMIVESVRLGIAGLEHLAGIPATVGGAAMMNAGGKFGDIAQAIDAVHAMTRAGEPLVIPIDQIEYDYRHSGLDHLIITGVDFALTQLPQGEHPALRARLKEVMAYKKGSQPLKEDSAGCVFRNPTLPDGQRVSAGMLIDRAGCKGLSIGRARVSEVHANFFITEDGAKAKDILDLMLEVSHRVHKAHGVTLEPEISIWRRWGTPA
ncbi:MAG: UDP-N-acetylmuramate dehydrogenase [Phycisphaerales bacterium]